MTLVFIRFFLVGWFGCLLYIETESSAIYELKNNFKILLFCIVKYFDFDSISLWAAIKRLKTKD
jgi:hypothetical protein